MTCVGNSIGGVSESKDNIYDAIVTSPFPLTALMLPQCSASVFGSKEIMQEMYHCYCGENNQGLNICKFCYNKCHLTCRKEPNKKFIKKTLRKILTMDTKNYEYFACECGIKLKHLVLPKNKEVTSRCHLKQIDKLFNIRKRYFCYNEQKNICSLCYFNCHKNCRQKVQERIFMMGSNYNIVCECQGFEHNNFNNFIFHIELNHYQKFINKTFWDVQYFNTFFNTGDSFTNLKLKFAELFLNKANQDSLFASLMDGDNNTNITTSDSYFPTLLEDFTETLLTKNYRYLSINSDDVCPLENIVEFLTKINKETHIYRLQKIKFRMMYLILFLHLKKDFSDFVSLSTFDFLQCIILKRLKLKHLIRTNNELTRNIYKKYKLDSANSDESIIDILIKDFIPFIEISLRKDIQSIMNFESELNVALKFIILLLKYQLLSIEDNKFLISVLSNLQLKFNLISDISIKDDETYFNWMKLLNKFSNIILMITVSYNDSIIEQILEEKRKDNKILIAKRFIHYKNELGEELFKIALRNYNIINNYNEKFLAEKEMNNDFSYYDTINAGIHSLKHNKKFKGLMTNLMKISLENIKMFSLSENSYYIQICKMSSHDIESYFIFKERIKSIHYSVISSNISNTVDNDNEQDIYDNDNLNELVKTKNEINRITNTFFSSVEMTHFLNNEPKTTVNNNLFRPTNDVLNKFILNFRNTVEKRTNKNNEHSQKEEEKHIENFLEKYYDYSPDLSIDYENVATNVSLSNIIDSITNIFNFFNEEKYIYYFNEDFLTPSLSLISFYFKTENGTKYLLLGRTLKRINKLFTMFVLHPRSRFSKESAETFFNFLFIMFKTFKKFNIDLSFNKPVVDIVKNLSIYLKNTHKKSQLNEVSQETKEVLNKLMFIYNFMYDYMTKKENEEIKNILIKILCDEVKKEFIFKSEFFDYYQKEQDVFDLLKDQSQEEETNKNEKRRSNSNLNPPNRMDNQPYLFPTKQSTIRKEQDEEYSQKYVSPKQMLTTSNNLLMTTNNNNNNEEIFDIRKVIPVNNEIKILYKFFTFICKNFYFSYSRNWVIVDIVYNFFYSNDGSDITKVFQSKKLKMKHRITLLKTISCFLMVKKINYMFDKNSFRVKTELTNNEYITYLSNKNLLKEKFPSIILSKNPKPIKENLDIKVIRIEIIEMLMTILINEFIQIKYIFKGEPPGNIVSYFTEYIFSIKTVSDFFYFSKDIFYRPLFLLKKISLLLTSNQDSIIRIINESKLNQEISCIFTSSSIFDESISLYDEDEEPDKFCFSHSEIYKSIAESIENIFKATRVHYKFSLVKYLDNYDNQQEYNFTPFSLIEAYDYEFFYQIGIVNIFEEEEKDNDTEKYSADINFTIQKYIKEFIDVRNSNFLSVLQNSNTDIWKINYRKILVHLFINYINDINVNINQEDELFGPMMYLITKALFYDTDEVQEIFKVKLDNNNSFFEKFIKILTKKVNLTFLSCRSIYIPEVFLYESTMTKLVLQFIQLLGEDFNISFHDNVFLSKNKELFPIFHFVVQALKKVSVLLDLEREVDSEMPYDKLIVLLSNLIDFIIEYLTTNEENRVILESELNDLFFGEDNILRMLKVNVLTPRHRLTMYVKIKILTLVISYLQIGKKYATVYYMLENGFNLMQIFHEILINFESLLDVCTKTVPKKIKSFRKLKNIDKSIEKLINLYTYEETFRDTLQLNLIFQLFILIKTYETMYNRKELAEHFSIVEKLIKEEDEPDRSRYKYHIYSELYSNLSFCLYRFLEKIILPVEIRMDEEDAQQSPLGQIQTTYFIRSYLTFFLSQQTMKDFEVEVERESTFSKFTGLLRFTDYFLFEMVVNRKICSDSKVSQLLCKLNYYYLELISFIFILIENIMLINEHYKSPKQKETEYFEFDKNKYSSKRIDYYMIGVTALHVIFIIFVIVVWVYYKYFLFYMKNILFNSKQAFIFRMPSDLGFKKLPSNVIEFFQEDNKSQSAFKQIKEIIDEYTVNMKSRKKYMSIMSTLLLNDEISVFIYTLFLLLLFFITKVELMLIFPLLFFAKGPSVLYSIFRIFKIKYKTQLILLSFIYIFAFVFMWLSFFFFSENFNLSNVKTLDEEERVEESFCYSSIQCWMHIIDFGVRIGGGIGDSLGKISYRTNNRYNIRRFFYDILFYFMISLILLNIFLGVIVDSYVELINYNFNKETDMTKICFICQVSEKECRKRNLSFAEHISKTHVTWNYIYFLISLHLENEKDFSNIKKTVWDKVGELDFSWIPLDKGKS